MKKLDLDTIKYLGKVILITLLIIFVVRTLLFQTFTISTSQMESALIKGDEVLVNKLDYGPRLPITLLNIPFTFDQFFGLKSYSDLINLPYKRLFSSELYRNEVVLFNTPQEIDKPLDKRNLLISRCIAVPGDTILISDGIYYINGKEYVHSPTLVNEYAALSAYYSRIEAVADSLYLDMNRTTISGDTVFFSLSRYDAFILGKNIDRNLYYRIKSVIPETLIFIVPSAHRMAALSAKNIKIYKQIIQYENQGRVEIKGEKIYIDDELVDTYAFNDDYYWMLSDNTLEALDSRELGFIPSQNIIGRVSMVLYSKGQKGYRSDRFFMPVD